MLDAGRHPNIEILAYSEVEDMKGKAGNFKVKIRKKSRFVDENICNACGDCIEKCPKRAPDAFEMGLKERKAVYIYFAQGIPAVATIDKEACTFFLKGKCKLCERVCTKGAIDYEREDEIVEHTFGAVIIATGLEMLDPTHLTQYGYKRLSNIITGLEYERLINATGPTGGHLLRPSDKKLAKKVAYIQCVGSRDLNNCKYCSSVCCMYAIKDAMLAREHDPEADSYIFHTDFRNVGKWFQKYEKKGEEEYGINYIRGRVAEVTEDEEKNPIVWYENTIERKVKSLRLDMVVLSTATKPSSDSEKLSKLFGYELDENGFVKGNIPYPTDTTAAGVFACGFSQGPADIPESVASASAAADRAMELLAMLKKKKSA